MLDKKQVQEIRAMLLITDTTFTDIAKKFGKSRVTIYKAVKDNSNSVVSKEIRAYIEEKVGRLEVWHIKNDDNQTTNK